jgi:hypothetical protein
MDNTKHDYSRAVQQRPIPQPENPQETAVPKRPYDTPQSDFPHTTHDLSALSRCYLDTSAFTRSVSMGAAARYGLHGSYPDFDVDQAYASLASRFLPTKTLLSAPEPLFDHSMDYNSSGVLCQVTNLYLLVMQEDPSQADGYKIRRRLTWLPKDGVSSFDLQEWESIPRQLIGKYCLVATGSTEGWWYVHSEIIMYIRTAIAHHMWPYAKLPTKEQAWKCIDAIARLGAEGYYRNLEKQEEKKAKEAESALREFTILMDNV